MCESEGLQNWGGEDDIPRCESWSLKSSGVGENGPWCESWSLPAAPLTNVASHAEKKKKKYCPTNQKISKKLFTCQYHPRSQSLHACLQRFPIETARALESPRCESKGLNNRGGEEDMPRCESWSLKSGGGGEDGPWCESWSLKNGGGEEDVPRSKSWSLKSGGGGQDDFDSDGCVDVAGTVTSDANRCWALIIAATSPTGEIMDFIAQAMHTQEPRQEKAFSARRAKQAPDQQGALSFT